MTVEAQDQDPGEQSLPEFSRAQTAPAFAKGLVGNGQVSEDRKKESLRTRALAAEVCPPGQRREGELAPEREALHQTRDREDVAEPRKGLLRRHLLGFFVGLFIFILAAAAGYLYWNYARHFQSTDDAFIAARQFAIAPKVSGYLTAVPVTDNQHLAAGDVIARIDDRDYRTATDQAEAAAARAQANIQNIDAQVSVQQAQISASQAQEEQAQAALVFAKQQATRYQDLAKNGYGSVQNAQQSSSQLRQQQAALENAQAAVKVAERQVEALRAQHESAVAGLAQAEAQRDQAQLNLSYTVVTAS